MEDGSGPKLRRVVSNQYRAEHRRHAEEPCRTNQDHLPCEIFMLPIDNIRTSYNTVHDGFDSLI